MMIKRTFAPALMALILGVSAFSTPAFAYTGETEATEERVITIQTSTEESKAEAQTETQKETEIKKTEEKEAEQFQLDEETMKEIQKLSIIAPQPYSNKGKQIEYPKPLTQREQLCMDLDEVLKKKPKSFEELVRFLQEADYEYKGGKQPAFRKKGQKRFIRLRSLDPEYSKESLEAIIAGEKNHKEKTYSRQKHIARPQMSLLIDIQAKLQQGKGAGYERWAKVFNLKQMAQAMVFYENHKFRDYGELEKLTAESVRKIDEMLASIKTDEARLAEIKVMKTHLQNYNKAKNVFAEYKKSGYSKKYFEEHRDVLTLRKAAKQAFDEY